mmetsp:Transcript_13184/g.20537  ORF Transcript_13184/g.20537 Transcript_13184/m.20537 type:complete len:91 (+) Transcript_13184:221-493(+)
MFRRLFKNFLTDVPHEEVEEPKMMKHLVSFDLAVYDQLQWDKIMNDISLMKMEGIMKSFRKLRGDDDEEDESPFNSYMPMSCFERLSHAI